MGQPQIYVRGFPKSTSDDELRTAFNPYGEVKEVRMIRDYAFIVFFNEESVNKAVVEMDGQTINQNRIRVEVAGQPRKPKGPQPTDECRYCGRRGHWKNDCPDLKKERRKRRRSRSSSSDSSSSSSSSSVKRKKKIKKHKSKHKKRKSSSSSSSQSSESSKKSKEKKSQNA